MSNEASNYLPLQPGFGLNRAYYIQFKQVKDPISQNMVLFYQFKTNKDSLDSTLAFPDGCIDIIFCCNPTKPSATCYGTIFQSKKIVFQSDCEYFGIRYLPDQGILLMKDLINKEIPLLDIISTDTCIVEKVGNANSFEERTKLFDGLINNPTFKATCIPTLVSYSVKRIYLLNGNINIDLLARETGYSNRYLRKQFEEFIGMSPKLFCQIVRFQNSLRMIIKISELDFWDVISENGYYDQSHFINQFKKFSNLTPGKFKDLFQGITV